MRPLSSAVVILLALGGCAVVSVPLAEPEFVPGGLLIGISSLEGRWVLAEDFGARFCLTIQDGRISIINDGCSSDGSGFAARIIEAPEAAIAGQRLVIGVRYNPQIFDESQLFLSFTGDLQQDGGYVGFVRVVGLVVGEPDETQGPEEIVLVEGPAVLARE